MALQEQVIEAVGVLRDDPLFYLVVVLPLFAVGGVLILYKMKHGENKELRDENKKLMESIMEGNKLSTQAITSQVEVMRIMRTDQKDALDKFDVKTEKIFTLMGEIRGKVVK